MANVTRTTTWSDNQVLSATDLNTEFNNLLSALNLVNADVSAGAGIVYSKLNLTGSIVDADISNSAAISVSKINSGLSGALVGTTDAQTLTNKTQVARVATYSPAGSGTTTLDLSTGGIQTVTMPAAIQTLAISNGTVGQCFIVNINNVTSQGALTWFTTIRWSNGTAPVLTGINGKRDTFGFIVTGAGTYDGYVVGQNI